MKIPARSGSAFARIREGASRHGHHVDVWTAFWVVCRATEKPARDYYEYVIERNGDMGVLDGVDPRVLPSTDGLSEIEARRVRPGRSPPMALSSSSEPRIRSRGALPRSQNLASTAPSWRGRL